MKKVFAFISVLFMLPLFANASNITNQNGIVLTDEEYENYSKVYPDSYLISMDQNTYDRISSRDYDNVHSMTKYIKTTYYNQIGLATETEVSEEEFNAFEPDNNTRNSTYETNMKKLFIAVIGGDTHSLISTLIWKSFPTVRSFDVYAIKVNGYTILDGSQNAQQNYTSNGTHHFVNYSPFGTNIKKFTNGFGISMNLVDNDVTSLDHLLECEMVPIISHPTVWGSYQHATSNVTLAQSHDYTLSTSGLGGVILFNNGIGSRYDGMTGVYINL